jgi:hypothetical protein
LEQKRQALEAQTKELDAQVDRQAELVQLGSSIEDFCRRIHAGLVNATFDQKRAMVELLVDRVLVADGEVEIRYVVPTHPNSEKVRFCHLRKDYFHNIVQVGAGPAATMSPEFPLLLQFLDPFWIGTVAVHVDHPGARVTRGKQGVPEEALDSCGIPSGGKQEIDGGTGRVDGPVQVCPLALHPKSGRRRRAF